MSRKESRAVTKQILALSREHLLLQNSELHGGSCNAGKMQHPFAVGGNIQYTILSDRRNVMARC